MASELAAASSVRKAVPKAGMSSATAFARCRFMLISFDLASVRCLVSFLHQKTFGNLNDRSSAGWHSTWCSAVEACLRASGAREAVSCVSQIECFGLTLESFWECVLQQPWICFIDLVLFGLFNSI